ncbi:MAG: S9 family peptidase [Acidobacteriota bacterium]
MKADSTPLVPSLTLVAGLCALFMGSASPSALAQRPLQVDDYFLLQSVSSPRISPNGNWVAYTVSTTNLEEESRETALWMAPTGEGEPMRMTAPGYSASSPRFSPDGRKLAFLSSRSTGKGESKTQVWAFDLRGGDAQPLTSLERGVGGYEWSPQGDRLLLSLSDEEPEVEGEEEEKPKPHVIDRLQFKRDYAGYLDRLRSHYYVYDLESHELRQITSGDFDDQAAEWSPDGKLIVFASNRTEEPDGNDNTDLWVVSADNSDLGRTAKRLTTNPGSDSQPSWSPDGRSVTFIAQTRPESIWYDVGYLAVVDLDSGDVRYLTESLDRNVSSPRYAPDGRQILFSLEDSATRQLARLPAEGGRLERVLSGERSVRSAHWNANGDIAFLSSTAESPFEVYWSPASSADETRLSGANAAFFEGLQLGEVKNVQFESADGTEIEGFITLPPDYDERLRYPTLLRIHGGPVAQYEASFDFESQLFAAHGYVVVRCNPRGSSGYGHEFSKAIWADWGNKDFQDVMAAVDHSIELGYTDPERLGVGGWSYGGILTNYVITQTERFEAAITGASEVLYISNYGHDHYQYYWEKELGLPWESRDNWERISPFNKVEKVTTPTLVMGGALDWNVPILNSEQLYQALRRRGIETQLVVYPNEHHGIRRPSFQKDRLERYLAWYDRYVKGELVEEETSADDDR